MARRNPESMVKRAREQALREKRERKQAKKTRGQQTAVAPTPHEASGRSRAVSRYAGAEAPIRGSSSATRRR